MRVNIFCEIKNKHQVDSKKKGFHPHDIIPDEANAQTCLNCPLPKCKTNCGLIKWEKK